MQRKAFILKILFLMLPLLALNGVSVTEDEKQQQKIVTSDQVAEARQHNTEILNQILREINDSSK